MNFILCCYGFPDFVQLILILARDGAGDQVVRRCRPGQVKAAADYPILGLYSADSATRSKQQHPSGAATIR